MTALSARSLLRAGGFLAAAACAALATFTAAQAAPQDTRSPAAAAAAAEMPVAVEDFVHPGADRLLTDRGITLKRGDGGITLTDCTSGYDIQVESRTADTFFCFTVTGKQGYLTMELPEAFALWTTDHPVRAKITAEGKTHVVNAPKNDYTPMGEIGDLGKPAVLLELRVTG
ncbi:hypothetical protein [Streptomyces clavuligerus]|uniref:hypothetical protein n=1 Tax=Streptomyces clavuligerus TaxID=1901 RepID=UPI0001800B35|nr:hypothetical protein [Streptomyces clavuligerus]EDY53075.1 conserved hypothetical protein [Streptomyces clavuligerus]WDN56010.1 hypothetical protein LL058_29430 [Streptomyces clavuligerus]